MGGFNSRGIRRSQFPGNDPNEKGKIAILWSNQIPLLLPFLIFFFPEITSPPNPNPIYDSIALNELVRGENSFILHSFLPPEYGISGALNALFG